MKSLRGKKGEDLIFGGTGQTARLGKASVALAFDNQKKIFDVPFDEVIISRRVYRDGANEYLLNNSQTRLKDIIELLSRVGLGASQHHIIGQGDADRILYASPKERKSMIEDALGLKIFEIKKIEAARKLSATEENLKNVESLRRELKPHLKYLEEQAKKSQNAAKLKEELGQLVAEYVAREKHTLQEEEKKIHAKKAPLQKEVEALEAAIQKSESFLGGRDQSQAFLSDLQKLDAAHRELQQKRRDLERERGRLEGESQHAGRADEGAVAKGQVRKMLKDFLDDLESAGRAGAMEAVRNIIFALTQKIYRVLEEISVPEGEAGLPADEAGKKKDHTRTLASLEKQIAELDAKEEELLAKKTELQKDYGARILEAQKESVQYRVKSDELARARDVLRTLSFEEQSLAARKKEFATDFAEGAGSGATVSGEGELFESEARDTMRRKIERLRIRLEEAGGVDDGVLREFEETQKRDEFLARELEDLIKAKEQVESMFGELETRIARDFSAGIAEINTLFGKFFHEIFGGGKAELKLFQPKPKKQDAAESAEEEWEGDESEEEAGLDIMVDIPRKRIKSLAMLSGGERALTSIALLFAVSTVNPPPFLVLDETDAALDEANSHRYGQMLEALSKKTQLVVITHNRETMKAASVLYGVTMGADGVSKLLSIKLEEAEDVLANS